MKAEKIYLDFAVPMLKAVSQPHKQGIFRKLFSKHILHNCIYHSMMSRMVMHFMMKLYPS